MKNEHILLRPSNLTDAPFRYNWFCDSEFTNFYLGRPTLTSYRQVEEEILFATYPAISTGLCELAIQTVDTNLYIGNTYFRKIDWQNRSAEYGIFLGNKELWGKKIGLEVTRMMLQYGFTELGLQRIWLTVLDYNNRAIKCFEKCGFQKEGVLRRAVFSGGQFHDVIIMSTIAGCAA
ncbi:MAG: N-acetyltransferase [Deltaproteobacteria bacterium HGW-Deltaproteobacteria-10]|nr:MAG: N-acetyltransferase [Deltaproteobacteria bacterium HGW-Deltaproteobacteria-10]